MTVIDDIQFHSHFCFYFFEKIKEFYSVCAHRAMMTMSNVQKDSQWLQLDVCREYQVGKCNKSDCKFAHPLAHVEVADGKVMTCYDSFKGRCRRVTPPCKYYHPTPPLMEILMARGRNHLAMKNSLIQFVSEIPQQLQDIPGSSRVHKIEIGNKRSAEISQEIPIEMMYFKRPMLTPTLLPMMSIIPQPIYQQPIPIVPTDRKLIKLFFFLLLNTNIFKC